MSFVRAARRDDAADIARIQRDIWVNDYSALMRQQIEYPDLDALAKVWSAAVESRDGRVLVATAEDQVVGFAAVAQIDADVEEIDPLHIASDYRHAGHGTRLLRAIADTAKERGITTLSTWALEGDHAWISLLNDSGFGLTPDQRTLDFNGDGQIVLVQHRWQTSLQED